MTLYLDASALVKYYVAEAGSQDVAQWILEYPQVGTNLISRAEVSAAITRTINLDVLDREDAFQTLKAFRQDWLDYIRLPITEAIVSRADGLAWELGLRGYDAVHLASALIWQEAISESVALATFDYELWKAGKLVGVDVLPLDIENSR